MYISVSEWKTGTRRARNIPLVPSSWQVAYDVGRVVVYDVGRVVVYDVGRVVVYDVGRVKWFMM